MSERGASSHLRICLFGAPRIATALGTITPAKPLVFAAALYIGLNRGRAIRREAFAAVLWPDVDDGKRSDRIRWLVRQLRIAGLDLVGGPREIELAESAVGFDADALASALQATQLLALVSADVLAGYDPQISDSFARWLDATRDAYRRDALRALGVCLVASRRAKSWQTMDLVARRMLELDNGCIAASAALADVRRELRHPAIADRANMPGSPVLFGRDVLLARLTETLTPSAGTGHRTGIAGPPGIGKSRLLEEFCRSATARGMPVVTVRCQRGDQFRPLSLAVDLTRTLLDLPGALGASPHSLATLARFTGAESPEVTWSSPEVRRANVYASMRDLIGALLDEDGLAIVIDDAQWAEAESWSLLAPAFTQRTSSPLSWTIAIRADSRDAALQAFDICFPADDAISAQDRELLWLAPMEKAAVAQLCAARAAPCIVPATALETLMSRADGSPFIAEALVDQWLEVGEVHSIPPSVARLVQGRIARLSPSATQLLRAIAVLGLDTTAPAAEAVASFARRELMNAVHELETSGILRGTARIMSAHALWTESILQDTASTTLQLLHRNSAEWLEQQTTTDEELEPRHYWSVANHWLEAGEESRAQRALERAATRLAENGFIAQAASMLERAGDLAGDSPRTLQLFHGAASLWVQELSQEAAEVIARLQARYDEVGRTLYGCSFSLHHEVELLALNAAQVATGQIEERQYDPRWLVCARTDDAPPLHRLRTAGWVLMQHTRHNLTRTTATALWRSIATIVPGCENEAWEYERCAVEYYSRIVNESTVAMKYAKRALAIFVSLDECDVFQLRRMASTLARCFERLGDLETSLALTRQLLERARRQRNQYLTVLALDWLIGTLLERGRYDEARSLLGELDRPVPSGVLKSIDRGRILHWATCALEEGNASLAREELIVPLELANTLSDVGRARVLSAYSHLALLERDHALRRALLPELLGCFNHMNAFMDHPALMTALALEQFEGWNAASAFVQRFVTTLRDEQWTPRPELLRFLQPMEQQSESKRLTNQQSVQLAM